MAGVVLIQLPVIWLSCAFALSNLPGSTSCLSVTASSDILEETIFALGGYEINFLIRT